MFIDAEKMGNIVDDKVVVVIIAMWLLAAGIYGMNKITQKFEWKKLGRDASYFLKFVETKDDNFP